MTKSLLVMNDMKDMRKCITCNSTETYIVPKTGKIKWYKKGLDYICNKCYRKEYYQKSDTIKNSVYNWRKNNPDKEREIKRKYAKNNPQVIRKASTKYKKLNPDKVVESGKKHFAKYGLKLGIGGLEYANLLRHWSKAVKKRDDNKCQVCGDIAKHSHHLLYRAKNPELSLNINNGLSLCIEHHNEVHGRLLN